LTPIREFAGERDERFGHRVDAQLLKGGRSIFGLLDGCVTSTVVAAAAGFEHDAIEFVDDAFEVFLAADADELRHRNHGVGQRLLLDEFVLDRPERTRIWINWDVVLLGNLVEEIRICKLDFEREGVTNGGEFPDGVGIVELANDLIAGDRRRGTLRGWIENDYLDAERCGGFGEHPPELAAADDAQRWAGKRDCHT